jgi:hypothetical protein
VVLTSLSVVYVCFSYSYRTATKTLIIMTPGPAHESFVVALHKPFSRAMLKQEGDHPELENYWELHTTFPVFYQDDNPANDVFQSDMALNFLNCSLFHVEVAFTQRWGDLVNKVGRILGCLGRSRCEDNGGP